MNKMRIMIASMITVLATMLMGSNAYAASLGDVSVSLGENLTAQQRASVLSMMELTEESLANAKVVITTNQQEHQYLGSYIASSVIGTKALSSVKIVKREVGHGVLVTTKNIDYCTTGMYRNALITAGLKDIDVLVVAPMPISGTAALIGAVKAYEASENVTISEVALDTALNELIITGEIATTKSYSSQDVEKMMAYLKTKIAEGKLKDEESVRAAIAEGERDFGITLSDEDKNKIVSVMNKINALGLDPSVLVEQAGDLYNKYGDGIFNNTEAILKDFFAQKVTGFLSGISDSITGLIKGIFK